MTNGWTLGITGSVTWYDIGFWQWEAAAGWECCSKMIFLSTTLATSWKDSHTDTASLVFQLFLPSSSLLGRCGSDLLVYDAVPSPAGLLLSVWRTCLSSAVNQDLLLLETNKVFAGMHLSSQKTKLMCNVTVSLSVSSSAVAASKIGIGVKAGPLVSGQDMIQRVERDLWDSKRNRVRGVFFFFFPF